MTFSYCQAAKQRIGKQGVSSVAAFLDEVPLLVRKKIIGTLPAYPGFRKNSAPEFKKKCERLVGAIAHAPDEKFRVATADWNAFGAAWASWGNEKFKQAFPKGPYSFAEISEEGALEFLRNLIDSEKSGCAREDVERLVLFSGLPSGDRLYALVDTLPLRATLERDRALAKLPEDVATLQRKVLDIGRNTEILTQDVRTAVTDASAAVRAVQQVSDAIEDSRREVSELEKPTSSPPSKEVVALSEQVAGQAKHFDSLWKDSLDALGTLESDLRGKYSSLQKSLSALASEMAGVKASAAAADEHYQSLAQTLTTASAATSAPNDESKSGAFGISPRAIAGIVKWLGPYAGTEPRRLESLESIFQFTQANLVAAGIRQTDADGAARTIVSATLTGQLIQFCGSLADVLGLATAASVGGGKVLSWQVPLGLCDGNDVETLVQQATGTTSKAQAILLRGVNRSAFEIYGTGIRDIVLQRQFSASGVASSQMSVIATWADGPATLPGSSALIELGPVVDADELTWSSSADWSKLAPGELAFDDLVIRELQSASGDEIAEALRLVDALGIPRNRLWRMALSRYISILFALPGSTYEKSLSVALSAWVLPWAKAKGVARDKLEDTIKAFASEQLQVASVRSALDELLTEAVA